MIVHFWRWCGILAGPIFIATFLLQAPDQAGDSPLRHPVNALALGEHGWIHVGIFLVTGLLVTGFAGGSRLTPAAPAVPAGARSSWPP